MNRSFLVSVLLVLAPVTLTGCLGGQGSELATQADAVYRVTVDLSDPVVGPLLTVNERSATISIGGTDGGTLPLIGRDRSAYATFLRSENTGRTFTLTVQDGPNGLSNGTSMLLLTPAHCRLIGAATRVEIVGAEAGDFRSTPEFLGVDGGACRFRRRF